MGVKQCLVEGSILPFSHLSVVHAYSWSCRSAFQMSIACTGRVTAVASMYIALHIVDSRGNSIPGSPIKLHLRKRCIAAGEYIFNRIRKGAIFWQRLKGLCKEFFFSKNPRLLGKWVGGSRSHSSQNSPKPALIFWNYIHC